MTIFQGEMVILAVYPVVWVISYITTKVRHPFYPPSGHTEQAHAAGVTCAIIAIVLGLIFLDDPLPTPSTQNQEIKIQDCVVQGKNADNTIDVRCKLQ